MEYKIDEINHKYWLNKGTWYNTDICLRFHGSLFEDFIIHARTGIYNLMCYLVAHDKIQSACEDDESSTVDRLIPKNATTEVLEALGATFNFIDIWLKLFEENYDTRCVAYITAMKYMSKKIPILMIKALPPKQKYQKL